MIYLRLLLFSALALAALPLRADSQAGTPFVDTTAAAPKKKLINIFLPDQVPYLNPRHRYVVGNGVGVEVGDASGTSGGLGELIGPGYSDQNFIRHEALMLEVDGVEQPLRIDLKRARETGIYYGCATMGDLTVTLIDYADRGAFSVERLVLIDNRGHTGHDIRVKAHVTPNTGPGRTQSVVNDQEQHPCGARFTMDKSINIPILRAPKGIEDRSVVIAFSETGADASFDSGAKNWIIPSRRKHVEAGGSYDALLVHYFTRGDQQSDAACLAAMGGLNGRADLEKSITDWQAWFAGVPAAYRLEKVTDPRSRDLLEGALAILKTNQSLDGGFVANETFYVQGFIRDTVFAVRGLVATGHFEETKQWLAWCNRKFELYGHFADCASCEPSLDDSVNSSFDLGNQDVEGPALVLLCARDYYRATGPPGHTPGP